MTRCRSLRVIQRDDRRLPRIQALKAEHPFWGCRRIWAYLRFVEQRAVNKKCILRLMREHHLLVLPNLRLKAKRTPTRSQPRPTKANERWGVDMTKVLVNGIGWVYIVVVLDWYNRTVVGYYAGIQCTAPHWLVALNMAVNRQFPNGARDQGLPLMIDNRCQPTSGAFIQACQTLGIQQALTSDNNPKGNAETERFRRTLNEECLWLPEWTSPFRLISALESWLETYHDHYLHSALGYKSPLQFEREHQHRHSTPFVAA